MAAGHWAARWALGACLYAFYTFGASPGRAEEAGPPPVAGPGEPASAGAPAPAALASPQMMAPLTANPDPLKFEAGPVGNVFVTGGQTGNVNRGVQVHHTMGPLALAFSLNDGFYSDRLSWLSGSATWTIENGQTLAFVGAGNTRTTAVSTFATPLIQNNSQVYNLIYTYTSGPWTVIPNLQFTYVPRAPSIGILHAAGTYAAALLANYTFDSAARLGELSLAGFSLPFRVEYI